MVLSPRGRRGLSSLRPEELLRLQTEDEVVDLLLDGVEEAFRRRDDNTRDGGDVIAELLDFHGWSLREIANEVSRRRGKPVSHSTIARWADEPGQNDPPDVSP